MASLICHKNGRKTIQLSHGTRPKIRLGKCDKRDAVKTLGYVERLVSLKSQGLPVAIDLCEWLTRIDETLHARLVALGFVEARQQASDEHERDERVSLGELTKLFLRSHRGTVKPRTLTTYEQTESLLFEFFDTQQPIDSITTGDARDFRNYLKTRSGKIPGKRIAKPLAEATIRKRCQIAKQFFRYAIDKELVDKNPFNSRDIPTTAKRSRKKVAIPHAMATAIMDELDHDWQRLVFALSRWGAMRVPSEPKELKWDGIDWEARTITFRCPKTEHHDGLESRTIPIWRAIEQPLREVYDRVQFSADAASEYVLPELREMSDSAIRKPILAAIKSAGFEPWPKLFTALRATRDRELRRMLSEDQANSFTGHGRDVAEQNYGVELTAQDYRDAIEREAVQNPVQNPAESIGNDSQAAPLSAPPYEQNPENRNESRGLVHSSVGPEGLEPPTKGL
jgi:site-specific recombinase XerD